MGAGQGLLPGVEGVSRMSPLCVWGQDGASSVGPGGRERFWLPPYPWEDTRSEPQKPARHVLPPSTFTFSLLPLLPPPTTFPLKWTDRDGCL